MMTLKVFIAISVLVVLATVAVVGIVLNRREYKTSNANVVAQGDFTGGYICIYSLLLIATGFIITKAMLLN